jgi:hypothetical protein
VEDLSYPACTRALYESEILGETLILALVQEAKTPRDRYHLGTLLQLESETMARLRPLLFKGHDGAGPDGTGGRRRGAHGATRTGTRRRGARSRAGGFGAWDEEMKRGVTGRDVGRWRR